MNTFMSSAIKLAIANVHSGRGGPFAAVVVRGGSIFSRGTNQVTSTNDPTAHAEVVAIREACRSLGHFQLTGCELYTTCEPCPMCLGAIYWARPERVFFGATREDAATAGFDDSMIYAEIAAPVEDRRIPTHQIMRLEALEAFRAWTAKADRLAY